MDKLLALPQGASYQSKQGRATVTASIKPPSEAGAQPTVYIEASCDSLQQLCFWRQTENDSLKAQVSWMAEQMQESRLNELRTANEQPSNDICIDGIIITACLMMGLLVIYLIKKKNE